MPISSDQRRGSQLGEIPPLGGENDQEANEPAWSIRLCSGHTRFFLLVDFVFLSPEGKKRKHEKTNAGGNSNRLGRQERQNAASSDGNKCLDEKGQPRSNDYIARSVF